MMTILLNIILYYFTLSNAQNICMLDQSRALRKLSKPVGDGGGPASIESVGAEACGDLLDHFNDVLAPWCACFKWPEVIDLITSPTGDFYFDDCRLSTHYVHAIFPVSDAVAWCDEDTPCIAVTAESVCVAKNCVWNSENREFTDENPTDAFGVLRKNYETIVAAFASDLEVPWIDGCEMLVAVYDQYHGQTCDDVVYEMKGTLEANSWPSNTIFDTTLREVCGETCWYQDQGAPYLFDRAHKCTSHLECNGNDPNVHDYFCVDCASCLSNDSCGICALTKYDTDVCLEIQQCTSDRSIDQTCASQTETLPDGTCESIIDQDDCITAHQNDPDHVECVWLDRLVKGKCVSDPCASGSGLTFCDHDACVKCSADANGEQSCVVDGTKDGLTCDDADDATDDDVCGTELYAKPINGIDKIFACKGTNVVEKLEEEKPLCTEFLESCCVNGEEYRCDNAALTYTRYVDGNCTNEQVETSYWNMDGTCSNVITTDAGRNIYFSGVCDYVAFTAQATVCSEEEFITTNPTLEPTADPIADSTTSSTESSDTEAPESTEAGETSSTANPNNDSSTGALSLIGSIISFFVLAF